MIEVEQKELKLAVKTAAEIAARGDEIEAYVRLVSQGTDTKYLSVIADNDYLLAMRNIECHESRPLDICVRADKLKAAVGALRVGKVRLEVTERGNLRVQQGAGAKVALGTRPSSEFPVEPAFDGMTQVYAGDNPAAGYKALKHVAVKNTGSQPLSDALVVMPGRSYVVTPSASVRCDFSLVAKDKETPYFAVPLASTWILNDFGETLTCHLDAKRMLVVDEGGWGVLRLHKAKLGDFPGQVDETFRALRELGQVKLNRQETLRAVSAASTILKGSKEAVLFRITCHREMIELAASSGGQSFVDTLPAKCSGSYVIPIHLARFRAFLAASDNDVIYVKVMSSTLYPDKSLHAVHMIDSRLHEIVWLPVDSPIEVANASVDA